MRAFQLSSLNKLLPHAKSKPVANGEIIKKIWLRRFFANSTLGANIYLAGCGRGSMLKSVWLEKSAYILAIDRDPASVSFLKYHFPEIDVREADFNSFHDWPKNIRFQIADFDPYGNPYDAIENFFRHQSFKYPFLAFVTDGMPLCLTRSGILPKQFRSDSLGCRLLEPRIRDIYFESLVWPWWHEIAAQYGSRVKSTALFWKKGKMVAYYAVQLDV